MPGESASRSVYPAPSLRWVGASKDRYETVEELVMAKDSTCPKSATGKVQRWTSRRRAPPLSASSRPGAIPTRKSEGSNSVLSVVP